MSSTRGSAFSSGSASAISGSIAQRGHALIGLVQVLPVVGSGERMGVGERPVLRPQGLTRPAEGPVAGLVLAPQEVHDRLPDEENLAALGVVAKWYY